MRSVWKSQNSASAMPHSVRQPNEVVKEISRPSSDGAMPARRGGDILVTSAPANTVTIYYNAALVGRRRAIFELNRGSTSADDGNSE